MDPERLLSFVGGWNGVAVLATIVETKGHAYRKSGAAMLFYGEGGAGRLGSISPGCLEGDLELRAESVWRSGKPEVAEYDMLRQDDLGFGEAVGCGGKITVLLEPVRGAFRSLLLEADKYVKQGETVTLLRGRGEERPRYELIRGLAVTEDPNAFAVAFAPRPRLVLFGAGLDVVPIASVAERIGFRIAVIDWRKNAAVASRFPHAELVVGTPEEAAARLAVDERDYVVVCSHSFRRDRSFIRAMLGAKPRYLGVVGSAARIRSLFGDEEPPAFVRAPAGLPIGADGPEEIAVAIAAEIIQARRAGESAPRKGVTGNEGGRDLFSGGTEQANGASEAFPGAFLR
ncbi:XdhC family protein [Paenibacillus antri]|uniref:XdhC family protein n=1 Tax=Paenibacillus antri TaxID=2582848 RepID=A0A5R9GF23_9BACL|nr:XdhC family protein [Paenibacillus antri]TLS52730.1 XdhC family protein [Paenibacillus antri]